MKRKEAQPHSTPHAYDAPLLEDDQRWRSHTIGTPVLVMDMVRSAKIWSALHPNARAAQRRVIVSLVARALGASEAI